MTRISGDSFAMATPFLGVCGRNGHQIYRYSRRSLAMNISTIEIDNFCTLMYCTDSGLKIFIC